MQKKKKKKAREPFAFFSELSETIFFLFLVNSGARTRRRNIRKEQVNPTYSIPRGKHLQMLLLVSALFGGWCGRGGNV